MPRYDKRAFLVFGPESSGTRLVTRMLMNWGCDGEDGHDQLLDSSVWWKAIHDKPEAIVWRRSFPHAGTWPEPVTLKRLLDDNGYAAHIVLTIRSLTPMMLSQLKVGHVRRRTEGEFKVLQALSQITAFALTFGIPWSMVTYEGLVHQKALRKALCSELALKWKDMEFVNGNAKHLEREMK